MRLYMYIQLKIQCGWVDRYKPLYFTTYTLCIITNDTSFSDPVAYPHATFKDVRLADYHIPKNSIILVNLSSVHLDPKLWDDPHQFRPERFIDTKGAFKQRDNFCPYGMGMYN